MFSGVQGRCEPATFACAPSGTPMAPPESDVGVLAHRIVVHETGENPDPAQLAVAVDKACSALGDDLTDVLGERGVAALLGRAVHLAGREHRLLAGVQVARGSTGCLSGLADALTAGTPEEAAAAGTAILRHLLDLLALLLGEELGLQAVRAFWPHVAFGAREIDP